MNSSGLVPPQYVIEESKFIPPPEEFLEESSLKSLPSQPQIANRKKNTDETIALNRDRSFLPISFLKHPNHTAETELRGVWLTNIDRMMFYFLAKI
jgi:uncharacterized lipoprotein YddW (UPF0748 family)